jgi:hypothetical protein
MSARSKPGLADTWRQRITAQQTAGLPIRAWCKQNRCHEHAFYWWRARLGLSPRPAVKRRPFPAQFAEAVMDSAPVVSRTMTLRLRGGQELAMPITQLAELVRAIEGMA